MSCTTRDAHEIGLGELGNAGGSRRAWTPPAAPGCEERVLIESILAAGDVLGPSGRSRDG